MASKKAVYRPYKPGENAHPVIAQLAKIMEDRGMLYKSLNTHRENVYRWLSGKRMPTLNSLDHVLKPMGLELQIIERTSDDHRSNRSRAKR